MNQIENKTLLAPGSTDPFKITHEEGDPPKSVKRDATVGDLIRLLIQRLPVKEMADAQHGITLLDLVPEFEQPDVLSIDNDDLVWLNGKVETKVPSAEPGGEPTLMLGLMAARLKEALYPMTKSEAKEQRKVSKNETSKEPVPEEVKA